MKSIVASIVVAAGFMIAGSAMAVDMPAEAGACKACHSVDKKVVGPAWMDVSKKYAGDKDAVKTISEHITSGGEFGWNTHVKMPPKGGTTKTPEEIKHLAEFVAGLSK